MKQVFITGVSSGIGLELAKVFLENGYSVHGCDLMPCPFSHASFHFYHCDVCDQEAFARIANEIPRPDIWINNAGLARLGGVDALSAEDVNLVIDVNIKAVIHGTKLAIERMNSPVHGHIVNIASLNGLIPTPFNSIYAASKHAVVGFTRSVQEEFHLRKYPLKISLVLPGFVKTKILESHQDIRFPKWLNWSLTSPRQAAQEIYEGIQSGKEEITCGLNGKTIRALFRYFPRSTTRSSRFLLSNNWREALGLDKIQR